MMYIPKQLNYKFYLIVILQFPIMYRKFEKNQTGKL